jgi:hypothetical protein
MMGVMKAPHHVKASKEQFLYGERISTQFVQEPIVSNRLRHLHNIATRIRAGLIDDLKRGEHPNPF